MLDRSMTGNLEHPLYLTFSKHLDAVLDRAKVYIDNAVAKIRSSDVKDREHVLLHGSYLEKILARGEITQKEVEVELANLLFAGTCIVSTRICNSAGTLCYDV